MSRHQPEIEEGILRAIRRIVRAVDVQSRGLAARCGLTGPQLVTLRTVARRGPVGIGALAREVSIGQATLTGILDRLERQQLVERHRDRVDRRKVTVSLTPKGRETAAAAPPMLHDRFRERLGALADWERSAILATLQRVAAMMEGHQRPDGATPEPDAPELELESDPDAAGIPGPVERDGHPER